MYINMLKSVLIGSIVFFVAVGLSRVNADEKNCCPRAAGSLKPYKTDETNNPEVTEADLLFQLNPGPRQIYQSMNAEGKALARELAGDRYRYNKNHAVRVAQEIMQERNGEKATPKK